MKRGYTPSEKRFEKAMSKMDTSYRFSTDLYPSSKENWTQPLVVTLNKCQCPTKSVSENAKNAS